MAVTDTHERREKAYWMFLWFMAPITMVSFSILVHNYVSLVILVRGVAGVPNIEVASMDFTVRGMSQTRLSADWDFLIRIPTRLPHRYICLQGDVKASLLYKNVTLVTSSRQKYNDLRLYTPQQLRVTASLSGEDIGGLNARNMIEDIKERREVKFGSQLFLTDCRENSSGVMRFVCDEITLRFEPGSDREATAFGNNPRCVNV